MSTRIIAKCPHCNNLIELSKAAPVAPGDGWRRIVTSELQQATGTPWGAPAATGAPADFASYERRQPAREPSLQGDVIVPAAQSVLTGLAVGVPGAAVLGLLGYQTGEALTTGAGLALFTIAGTWLVKLGLHERLLWLVEVATGRDFDGDGATGQPAPVAPVRIELAQGPRTRLVDLPATDAQLSAIATAVLSGGTFSRRGLADIVNESEYKALVGAMLAGGLLASRGNGGNAGVELTSAGRAVLKKVVVAGGGGAGGPETTNKSAVGEGWQ